MRLWVSMGQRAGGDARAALRPVLSEVDLQSGEVTRELALEPDPAWGSGPHFDDECTAPSMLIQGVLLQPTHTAIWWICPDSWAAIDRFSHPLLHSTHSAVARPGGGFAVSCAGTDSILEFDGVDQLVAHHCLRDGDFSDHFDLKMDFRTAEHNAYKPHQHHPNHAFYVDGQLWVTCFETQRAFAVHHPDRSVTFPEGMPHDGPVQEGRMWFTTVSGQVIGVNPQTLEREVEIDLNALCDTRQMLGWCRGVAVRGDRMWVGMSQLRSTTHLEVLRILLKGEAGRKRPTRVIELDWKQGRVLREIELGNDAGGTIYGVTLL
ncbi:MAG: hypothetical protein GWP91_22955 [Rhodobacterales bacterium]|nr:hypothetical protein [Rhodobacterales bacterium]